jgi:hypothetical protein
MHLSSSLNGDCSGLGGSAAAPLPIRQRWDALLVLPYPAAAQADMSLALRGNRGGALALLFGRLVWRKGRLFRHTTRETSCSAGSQGAS